MKIGDDWKNMVRKGIFMSELLRMARAEFVWLWMRDMRFSWRHLIEEYSRMLHSLISRQQT